MKSMKIKIIGEPKEIAALVLVEIKDQKLYFYESKNSNNCFSVTVSKNFPKNNVNMLKIIYFEMLKIRHKNYDNSIKNKYDSLQHLKKIMSINCKKVY